MSSDQHMQLGESAVWWQQAADSVSAKRRDILSRVHDWASQQEAVPLLRVLFDSPSRDLATVTEIDPQAPLRQQRKQSRQRLRELVEAIARDFSDKTEARDVLNLLGRVIELANRSRLRALPLPPYRRRVKPQKDPFERGDPVRAIRLYRDIRRVIAEWILETADGPVPLELILLSAITHGDLLHPSMAEALLKRLYEAERCILEWWGELPPYRFRASQAQRMPYVDLSLRWGTTADAQLRRWFVDPQTACLLVHAPVGATEVSNYRDAVDKCWRSARRALIERGLAPKDVPTNIGGLFRIVQLVRRADNYPALVVNHSTGVIVSHALKPTVLPRLCGEKAICETSAEGREQETSDFVLPARRDGDYESEWYDDLRAALRGDDAPAMLRALEERMHNPNSYPPSAMRIFEYAAFALVNGSAAGGTLQPTTVRAYTSLIARHLGGMLEGRDPATMPIDDLLSVYEEVLDAVAQGKNSRGKRRRMGVALHEFHTFLVRVHRVQGVNPGAVFGFGRDLIAVDANLISLEEYNEVRSLIRVAAPTAEMSRVGLVIASVGFWLGLRRWEALGLRIRDVADRGVPTLILRDWTGRKLKTPSSTRITPLTLLPENECNALIQWKEKRLAEDGASVDDYLFTWPALARDVVNTQVITVIQHAMREVTNDTNLRYHHLRHSFANWAYLRLCLAEFADIPDLFPKLPLTSQMLGGSAEFRRLIYEAFPVSANGRGTANDEHRYSASGPTGSIAFAVARLLGHADPSTTFENYIHLLDLVTPLYRERADFFPADRKSIIAASRLPASTAYRHGDSLPAAAWAAVHQPKEKLSRVQVAQGDREADPGEWIENTWQLLYAAETGRFALDELAATYNYDSVAEVETLLSRAQAIRDLVDPTYPERPLHTMTIWTPDRRYPDRTLQLACPWRPNHQADVSVIRRLAKVFASLPEESIGLCEWAVDYFALPREAPSSRYAGLFAGHQKGVSPLVFDTPADAKRYLEFLDVLGLIRKRLTDRSGNTIAPSEIRFISYGVGAGADRWKQELGINWRDDCVRDDRKRPDLLGVLVHCGTAPGRLLYGSRAFRFSMLMAAIARPWRTTQQAV